MKNQKWLGMVSRNYCRVMRIYGSGRHYTTVRWFLNDIHRDVLNRIKETGLHLEKGEEVYIENIPGTTWDSYEIELYRGYGERSTVIIRDYSRDVHILCEISSDHDWILAVS